MAKSGTTIDKDVRRLTALLRTGHPCISILTEEEPHALQIAKDAAADMMLAPMAWTAVRGLYDPVLENGSQVRDTENLAAALLYVARLPGPCALIALDAGPHMADPRAARAARELAHQCEHKGGRLILIDCGSDVPEALRSVAVRFEVSMPDDLELEELAKRTLREVNRKTPLDVSMNEQQLQTMVRNLRGLTRRQAELAVLDAVVHDERLDESDITGLLDAKRKLLASEGTLEFVDAPADLSEIAGLRVLKRWLTARQNAFDARAQSFGLEPPRGVLMLGVQGTGKSLTAKAIASAWKRPLLRLDAGALYDRYIGESERRLRSALRQAEAMSPVILWIDEIEKAFASAGSASNDGGLSRRMFGSLLTWMQEHRAPVFLIATANDIDALPPELLRKGRFDEIFFVDLPSEDVRREVLAIHLRKRKRDPKAFDIDRLAACCQGYSPAELEQAIRSALHEAFAAGTELTTEMLEKAIVGSPPLSVTAAEKVAALRRWARGRCVAADDAEPI